MKNLFVSARKLLRGAFDFLFPGVNPGYPYRMVLA